LKNSLFVKISQKLGDRKCLGDPRKSIVGLPDAILFLPILRERVFQQPQAIAPNDLGRPVVGAIGMLRQLRQGKTD
jgi:hypothetical protein